jgi:hypothetical protein
VRSVILQSPLASGVRVVGPAIAFEKCIANGKEKTENREVFVFKRRLI